MPNLTPPLPCSPDYLSVRGNRSFSSGKHSIEFVVLGKGHTTFGVGVVNDSWECRAHCATTRDTKQQGYCYWSDGSICTEVGYVPLQWTIKRHTPWGPNDLIGIKMVFSKRQVHFFNNGTLVYTLPMSEEEGRPLWPYVVFYGTNDAVRLAYKYPHWRRPPSVLT